VAGMHSRAVRTLAIANQKGGVGKTTTAINLGTALAAVGEQVLIIDLDPQGNASTGVGVPPEARHATTFDVLTGKVSIAKAMMATAVPGLSIVPANSDLVGLETDLMSEQNRPFRLRDAVAAFASEQKVRADMSFSYVLIDCPPSLNLLTINALVAADAVLVPLQCEFFALEGLSQLLQTIEQIRSTLNPRLSIQGVVMTMFDRRNSLSEQVLNDVRGEMGQLVYDTVIPRNVRLSEAPSYGKPALLYDLKCAGSQAYLRLATEVIRRERQLVAA
jgi:chromosome partitioning protein